MAICGLGLESVEVGAGLGRTLVGEEGGNCPSWRARSRRERCTNTGHHGLIVSLMSLFHTGGIAALTLRYHARFISFEQELSSNIHEIHLTGIVKHKRFKQTLPAPN